MHTWTVSCDPFVAGASGTAATEHGAVVAAAATDRGATWFTITCR